MRGQPAPPGMTVFQQARALGYEHLLFISWPHLIESGGERVVRALKESVEDRLQSEGIAKSGDEGPNPVFLDKPTLHPGQQWEPTIRKALCYSVATLVVVVPTYFQSKYCALEWAITVALEKRRLPTATETCFLLLPFAGDPQQSEELRGLLPAEVRRLNFIKSFDRKKLLRSRNFAHLAVWNTLVDELIAEMRRVARLLVTKGSPDWVADQHIASLTGPFSWTLPGGALPVVVTATETGPATVVVPPPVPMDPFPTFKVEGKAA